MANDSSKEVYKNIKRLACQLLDLQNQIKGLKSLESSIKNEITKHLKKEKLSGGEFVYLNNKYKISLVEKKYSAPMNEQDKINGIETALISIGDMKIDQKSKSQLIHNKLKENIKTKVSTTLKITKN